MHTIYSDTQYTNESKHSEMGPVRQNSENCLVCSYVCALPCAQLLHTILHRTDLIIFPLTLQTITIAPMMSTWGKGAKIPRVRPIPRWQLYRYQYWHQYLRWSHQKTSSQAYILVLYKTLNACISNINYEILPHKSRYHVVMLNEWTDTSKDNNLCSAPATEGVAP